MLAITLSTAILLAPTGLDWVTISSTLATVVGAGGLVKLYNAYSKNRKEKRDASGVDGLAFRESLQNRVEELEDKIDILQDKIEDMITMYTDKILELSTENATLGVQAKNLREENQELKAEVRSLRNQ